VSALGAGKERAQRLNVAALFVLLYRGEEGQGVPEGRRAGLGHDRRADWAAALLAVRTRRVVDIIPPTDAALIEQIGQISPGIVRPRGRFLAPVRKQDRRVETVVAALGVVGLATNGGAARDHV